VLAAWDLLDQLVRGADAASVESLGAQAADQDVAQLRLVLEDQHAGGQHCIAQYRHCSAALLPGFQERFR
jgi:hypothetical protein